MKPIRDRHYKTQDYWVYNTKYTGNYHTGIDYGTHSANVPCYAIFGGVVHEVIHDTKNKYGYGNHVIIYSPELDRYALYAHLQSTDLKEGSAIQEGGEIGIIGTTGFSTGVHLHLEVYKKTLLGKKIYENPEDYYELFNEELFNRLKGKFVMRPHSHGEIYFLKENGTLVPLFKNNIALDFIAEELAIGLSEEDFSSLSK